MERSRPDKARSARPALTLDGTNARALDATASQAKPSPKPRIVPPRWYAAQLLAHYGRAQVLDWLRSGVPAGVVAALGQR